MADLQTWANVAEILGGASILGGVAFAVHQMRRFRTERQDAAAASIIQTANTTEFRRYVQAVLDLPDAAPAERVRSDPALRLAADAFIVSCESFGFLVHSRAIDLHALDRMAGGFIRSGWRKLRPFVEGERQRFGDANYGEWHQWLVERMEEDPAPGKALGAHVAFKDWRRR